MILVLSGLQPQGYQVSPSDPGHPKHGDEPGAEEVVSKNPRERLVLRSGFTFPSWRGSCWESVRQRRAPISGGTLKPLRSFRTGRQRGRMSRPE